MFAPLEVCVGWLYGAMIYRYGIKDGGSVECGPGLLYKEGRAVFASQG